MDVLVDSDWSPDGRHVAVNGRASAPGAESEAALRLVAPACRKLDPGEAAAYRALRLESLERSPELFSSTYEEEANKPRLPFEAAIDAGAHDRFVVGAFLGQQLIGIAAFAGGDRQKTAHRGNISQVYVHPDRRGRSAGRKLVRTAVELGFALPWIEQIELGVIATNDRAVVLYERLGFRMFGLCKGALKSGDRQWSMLHLVLTRDQFITRTT